ncbi:MAG TPA: hypothetical protein VFC82_10450 [Actinomycetaceae bacterium]|nr:hypothetical protein [Actinomycetaceae bacterium]
MRTSWKSTLRIAAVATAGLALAGCAGGAKFPRNEDGGFVGTVTSVGRDNLRMDVGEGNMWVDTWAVCGDHTSQHISVGDEIVVFADRELFSYDAWRILDVAGEPACDR